MIDASNLPKIAAVTAIVAFGIYRRVRRNIGRQILTATRQYVRMGLISVLCLVLTFLHPLQPVAAAYIGSGLIIGGVRLSMPRDTTSVMAPRVPDPGRKTNRAPALFTEEPRSGELKYAVAAPCVVGW